MQRIANDSSDGKSGQIIDRYTIDNKKHFVDNITNLATKKNVSSEDIKKQNVEFSRSRTCNTSTKNNVQLYQIDSLTSLPLILSCDSISFCRFTLTGCW